MDCLYQLLLTFFVQNDVDSRNELLKQCHLAVYNIEKDLMCLTPEGEPLVFERDQFNELVTKSRQIADSFNEVQQRIASSNMDSIKEGLQSLRKMLEVLDCFEGT